MKSSLILASALATMAVATPAVKTEVVYDYVTVTVTGTGPSPTAAAPSSDAAQFFSAAATTDAPASDVAPAADDSSSSTAAPAAAPASSADTSNLSDYAAPIIAAHNKARAQHSAPDLVWDDNLASIAQTIGQTCIYDHNTQIGGGGYGQNIAAGAGPGDVNTVIYNSMYEDEIKNYNAWGGEPDINSLGDWGHATQIIWVGSTKVGCATVQCGTLQNAVGMAPEFTVCNYEPAGNMIGAFAQNVLPN